MNRMSLKEIQNRNESGSGEVLIACKGKVFNVSGSSRWKDGTHMKRHKAGEDLTPGTFFSTPWRRCPGSISGGGRVDTDPAAIVHPGGFLGKILTLHPHPVSVHFPIALILTASVVDHSWLAAEIRIFYYCGIHQSDHRDAGDSISDRYRLVKFSL